MWCAKESRMRVLMRRLAERRPRRQQETEEQRNRGTGDWNVRGIMIVLLCGKPKFISLPVSPPIYRSKSAKLQLCTKKRPEV